MLRALRSGWVAPTGPEVTAFEDEMAERCGVAHAVAMVSGTAALHLAMEGVGAGPGDVVIVPTMTFVASANAVVYTGAQPGLRRRAGSDGNLDPDLLSEAIDRRCARRARRVGAVMSVDLLGQLRRLRRAARGLRRARGPADRGRRRGAGCAFHGKQALGPAGSFGRVAALSFNGNKIMTTSGGGMLLSDDEALAEHARFLSTQAREPVAHYEHRAPRLQLPDEQRPGRARTGPARPARRDDRAPPRRSGSATPSAVADWPGRRGLPGRRRRRDNCWLTALVVDPRSRRSSPDGAARRPRGRGTSRPGRSGSRCTCSRSSPTRAPSSPARRSGSSAQGVTLPSGSVHGDEAIERVCAALDRARGALT